MNKWVVYVLGILTGILLTLIYAVCVNLSENSGVDGLEMFKKPGKYMDYSQFEVFQVLPSGCALANADELIGPIVFIIPDENQQFYDNQKIILKSSQRALHVGTYKYYTKMEVEKTVPAIKIVEVEDSSESDRTKVADNSEKTLEKTVQAVNVNEGVEKPKTGGGQTANKMGKIIFDQPGDCVSTKSFEVQKVLDSGDAIALEVRANIAGQVITSDLEVLILAHEGSNFYNKQIVQAPEGKCARQVGNYKYKKYGDTKVIPIIDFM